MMLALVHPRAFMPVHGELRMLAAHAALAESVGVPADRIHVCDNGDVLVLERGSVRREGTVEAGVVFVDGLGIGDPKDAVLRDRRQLSADGTLIIVCQLHRGPNARRARGHRPRLRARGRRRRRRAARRGARAREHDPRPPRRRRRARAQAAPEPPARRARRARVEPRAQAPAGAARRRRRVGGAVRMVEVLDHRGLRLEREAFFAALAPRAVRTFCDLRQRAGHVAAPEYAFAQQRALCKLACAELRHRPIEHRRSSSRRARAIRQSAVRRSDCRAMGVGKRDRSRRPPSSARRPRECLAARRRRSPRAGRVRPDLPVPRAGPRGLSIGACRRRARPELGDAAAPRPEPGMRCRGRVALERRSRG